MTYARGTYGLDSSDCVDYASGVQSGSRFHFRYSAGEGRITVPDTHFKLCQPGEIATIVAAGCDFVANMEWSEDTPTQGFEAGQRSGAADLEFWQSMGLNRGSSIYISWEPGNDGSLFGVVEQFIRGYNQELSGVYVADALYAGIPALKAFGRSGLIRHGWIPESTNASDIPNDHGWIWKPTKAQLGPAMSYLDGLVDGSGLESIIWQNGNKWFPPKLNADEDIVLLGGPIGSHLEAAGLTATPVIGTGTFSSAATPAGGPHFQSPWPGATLHFAAHEYFGNINGPSASHGGANAAERPYVAQIQERLLWLGLVPGHSYPSGWADGIFDVQGQGGLGGPTTDAVTRFQAKYRPGPLTTQPGKVFADDWATLFSATP